jgi:NADPH-dependent 2,4-dienoyl-CoA reductase/sulfur reductase-like enzyme
VSDIFSAVVRLVMVACGFAGLALAAVAAKSRQEITAGDRHDRLGGGPSSFPE